MTARFTYAKSNERLIGRNGKRRVLMTIPKDTSLDYLKNWFIDLYTASRNLDSDAFNILQSIITEDTGINAYLTEPTTLFDKIHTASIQSFGQTMVDEAKIIALIKLHIVNWHYEMTRETPPKWYKAPKHLVKSTSV